MDRYLEVAKSATPPSAPAASAGYPTNGNPQTATPATEPGEWWFHMITEEIRAVIVGAGLTPDHAALNQLTLAIQSMIVGAQKAVVINGVTFDASVTNGKVVRWDSANSRFDESVADGSSNNRAVGVADVTNSKVYLYGECPLFSGLTPGARYYLDGSTVGAITATAPTDAIMVGIAKSATTLWVDIDVQPTQTATYGVRGAFKNLQLSATGTSGSTFIGYDELVLEDGSNNYKTVRAGSFYKTTAAWTVGSLNGGLDTGAIAASTWYSVWVIYNPTTQVVDGLLSLSATAPTMPSGYTYKARVGWVRTDGTANKYPLSFFQKGRCVRYAVASGTNVAAMPIMASGTAGSPTTPTWVSVAIGNFVPSTAGKIDLVLAASGSICSAVAPNNAYGATTSTTNPPPVGTNPAANGGATPGSFIIESSNIYWASNGACEVLCSGWEDNL